MGAISRFFSQRNYLENLAAMLLSPDVGSELHNSLQRRRIAGGVVEERGRLGGRGGSC